MPYHTRSFRLAAGLFVVAGISSVLFASSVLAVSPVTNASHLTRVFLANLVPNVDFLDRSSRFALTNSKNAKLRAFALAEAREQTRAADALFDWTIAEAPPMSAPAAISEKDLDRTPTSSTAPAWPLPIIDPKADAGSGVTSDTKQQDERVPRGQEDLDSMEGLDGKAFDAEYKTTQRDALEQVEADYRDYIAKGDDPRLLALAKRELATITKCRSALGKI